jgi:hypothetical protein
MVDSNLVEELKAFLQSEIGKEELALRKEVERLRAFRLEASSASEADELTAHMDDLYLLHKKKIEPLRSKLEAIVRAQLQIEAIKPGTVLILDHPHPLV